MTGSVALKLLISPHHFDTVTGYFILVLKGRFSKLSIWNDMKNCVYNSDIYAYKISLQLFCIFWKTSYQPIYRSRMSEERAFSVRERNQFLSRRFNH